MPPTFNEPTTITGTTDDAEAMMLIYDSFSTTNNIVLLASSFSSFTSINPTSLEHHTVAVQRVGWALVLRATREAILPYRRTFHSLDLASLIFDRRGMHPHTTPVKENR